MKRFLASLAAILATSPALAAPVNFTVDPGHTHPSFEVDHFGGMSIWRGTFRKTTGTIVLDTAAKTGSVDVIIDVSTVELAHDLLNKHVRSPDILDTEKFPTAEYKGKLTNFVNDAPTAIVGELTLHGVTKPVNLTVNTFKCLAMHPARKRPACGADATGTFNRADFGVDHGVDQGFKMDVLLRISVEAVQTD
jgi:polyisoprenoid-binding protein YceI